MSYSSNTKVVQGNISVPKSIQRIKTVVNGKGILNITNPKKGTNSEIFDVKQYAILFLRLSNIFLPSSIPMTMLEKSSFNKIISAASFATSDPVIPIATPISAFLIAGESLTPSPVTATI
jgi:hypothetical protein